MTNATRASQAFGASACAGNRIIGLWWLRSAHVLFMCESVSHHRWTVCALPLWQVEQDLAALRASTLLPWRGAGRPPLARAQSLTGASLHAATRALQNESQGRRSSLRDDSHRQSRVEFIAAGHREHETEAQARMQTKAQAQAQGRVGQAGRGGPQTRFKNLSIRVEEEVCSLSDEVDSCLVEGSLDERLQRKASFMLDEKPEMRRNVSMSERHYEATTGLPEHTYTDTQRHSEATTGLPERTSTDTQRWAQGEHLGEREAREVQGTRDSQMQSDLNLSQNGPESTAGSGVGCKNGQPGHSIHDAIG